jgi:hypothetical protein
MRLTARQRYVMQVLESGNFSPVTPVWYPLRASQVRSVLASLYNRHLVERARWNGNACEWQLTHLGRQAIQQVDE